jgi:hypothetical protein
MKLTSKYQKLIFGALASLSFFSLLIPQLAKAQSTQINPSTQVNPLQDFQPQKGDPFSSRNDNPTGSLFDLIHRAQLGSSRSAEEFNTEKNQSLNDAAAEFRKKQQQRIQNPSQAGTVENTNTTTTPSLQINLDK